jgi:hypothetical protein
VNVAVGLLSGPVVAWELKFGSWMLLQSGRINAYAQAAIQTTRADEHECGCLVARRAKDNSPAIDIYRWVSGAKKQRVPSGTKEQRRVAQRFLSPCGPLVHLFAVASDESLGY